MVWLANIVWLGKLFGTSEQKLFLICWVCATHGPRKNVPFFGLTLLLEVSSSFLGNLKLWRNNFRALSGIRRSLLGRSMQKKRLNFASYSVFAATSHRINLNWVDHHNSKASINGHWSVRSGIWTPLDIRHVPPHTDLGSGMSDLRSVIADRIINVLRLSNAIEMSEQSGQMASQAENSFQLLITDHRSQITDHRSAITKSNWQFRWAYMDRRVTLTFKANARQGEWLGHAKHIIK